MGGEPRTGLHTGISVKQQAAATWNGKRKRAGMDSQIEPLLIESVADEGTQL
ncbi:hypothetical protein HPL003_04430 [Paenibacillus terrae HPL-003]|uniref:Uncharacterized protein n=1 Tax=Paenibacillus terrae (strain HPL-003) TaxID=985665 RepID=G7VUP8_PAETH|nr:hypothetical protein HPL003_04430 [Paenibacillus terrae HPL-003]